MNKILIIFVVSTLLTSCFKAADNPSRKTGDNSDGKTPRGDTDVTRPTVLADSFPSYIYRDKGSKQYTLNEINKYSRSNTLPTTVKAIANPYEHNDSNVTKVGIIAVNCGDAGTLTSTNERIEDCKNKNPAAATWDGAKNSFSGEGQWSLIYSVGSNEAWLDKRTGLVWSSTIEDRVNWKKANGYLVDEDEAICQHNKIRFFNNGDVKWRLPNRNEFLQADINGLRYVLSETDMKVWTATSSATNIGYAWAIYLKDGILSEFDMNNEDDLAVICIGEVLK